VFQRLTYTKILDEYLPLIIHQKIEAQGTVSFVESTKKDEILQLKFDVVKHIIEVRQEENKAKVAEEGKQAQRDKLNRLIANAEDAQLASMTPEQLKAMRDAL